MILGTQKITQIYFCIKYSVGLVVKLTLYNYRGGGPGNIQTATRKSYADIMRVNQITLLLREKHDIF